VGRDNPQASPSSDSMRTIRVVGPSVVTLVAALMAWDHLWGNERGTQDSFPVDPSAFVVAMAISLACAGLVFLVLVPRTRLDPRRAPRRALWLSGLAVPLTVVAGWLGFPLIIAGGGIALGLLAPSTPTRSRAALAAIAVGLLVLVFGIISTAFPVADTDG